MAEYKNGMFLPENPNAVMHGDGEWRTCEAYPLGAVFISTVDTNPNTLLGYGVWQTIGAGRVPVGVDLADADFNAAGKTGGSKTKTLSVNEIPAHSHGQSIRNTGTAGTAGTQGGSAANNASAGTTANTGGGQAFSIMNPFFTVFMWERIE